MMRKQHGDQETADCIRQMSGNPKSRLKSFDEF